MIALALVPFAFLAELREFARGIHPAVLSAHGLGSALEALAGRSGVPVEVVEIADDGVGGADTGKGTGLRGLADRLAALGGTLEVESVAGTGTTVRATIPLPSPNGAPVSGSPRPA